MTRELKHLSSNQVQVSAKHRDGRYYIITRNRQSIGRIVSKAEISPNTYYQLLTESENY